MFKKRLLQLSPPGHFNLKKYRIVTEEKGNLKFYFHFEHDILLGNASGSAGNFFNWDRNEDGVISRDEVNPQKNFS